MNDIPHDAAVIDRIEDGQRAVLLVGPDEVELLLDVALLPAGAVEGDWLRLSFTVDAERSELRRVALAERLERIRRTRGGSRFA